MNFDLINKYKKQATINKIIWAVLLAIFIGVLIPITIFYARLDFDGRLDNTWCVPIIIFDSIATLICIVGLIVFLCSNKVMYFKINKHYIHYYLGGAKILLFIDGKLVDKSGGLFIFISLYSKVDNKSLKLEFFVGSNRPKIIYGDISQDIKPQKA